MKRLNLSSLQQITQFNRQTLVPMDWMTVIMTEVMDCLGQGLIVSTQSIILVIKASSLTVLIAIIGDDLVFAVTGAPSQSPTISPTASPVSCFYLLLIRSIMFHLTLVSCFYSLEL